jgi:hypothetical protein
MGFSRWNKVWIVVSICSLLAYALNSTYTSFSAWYMFLLNGIPTQFLFSTYFLTDYVGTTIGVMFRVIGAFAALTAIYLFWGPKHRPFLNVKKKIVAALLFEGIYFLLLLPINVYYLTRGLVPVLFVGYILETAVVSPTLFILGFKLWRYTESAGTKMLKWISLAAIGYLVHIWIGNLFRWFSMIGTSGITFLFNETILVGFLNSAVTLSLSLILAIVGFFFLSNKGNRNFATKMFGIALTLVGLHFVIYITYSLIIGSSVSFILLTEIWPVTLLGLGLSMLLGAKTQTQFRS